MKWITGSAWTALFNLALAVPCWAQQGSTHTGRAWTASLINESTAIPYTRFFTTPVHPGVQVGTEFPLRQGRLSRFYATAHAGYVYHNYLFQGVYLGSDLAYEHRLDNGFCFGALLGASYLHTFATTVEWRFENGHYVQKGDTGNARVMPSLTLETGYYLGHDPQRPKLFVRYQSWAEYPYSPGFIPVLTHISLHIGARVVLGRAKAGPEPTPAP
ncbi:MAG: hypothetical protein IPP83_11055 [Flavobacteriales bacterium]|nr:hypothetical protein [Flavobacteriales bacterium]